jgi:hypothetical protein
MESEIDRRNFLKKGTLGVCFLVAGNVSGDVFDALEENYILEQKAVFYGIDHSD